MREIKFRCWDKRDKEMYGSQEVDIEFTIENACEGGGRLCAWIEEYSGDVMDFKRRNDTVLMQYTGLKDKNGKEIYEGDIIEATLVYEGWSVPTMGSIVYENKFGAFGNQNEAGVTLLHNLHLNSIEILGNIHENPELLK